MKTSIKKEKTIKIPKLNQEILDPVFIFSPTPKKSETNFFTPISEWNKRPKDINSTDAFKKKLFWKSFTRSKKSCSEDKERFNIKTKSKKIINTAKPEILCSIEVTPMTGRLLVNIFKYTGRLSFSFIRDFNLFLILLFP